jgi:hypothetical protein
MPSPSFRLEVNAELIVHGATEPDATLKIGEHTVPLEPDGAFSLRFSLPDGVHTLPVVAISARTGEQRTATLRFSRHTQAQDQVSAARLEPGLKPPSAENL